MNCKNNVKNIKKKIDLDISNYTEETEISDLNLEWFDLNDVKKFRDDLCISLIEKIKLNINKKENQNINVNLSINIFFKWFASNLIELFFCLKSKDFLKRYEDINIPDKYEFLKDIILDNIPKTNFEKLKENPYLSQNIVVKFFKNLIRFFQINSIADIFRNITFQEKSVSILYTNFLGKNLYNNSELNLYKDLSFFFKKNIINFKKIEDKFDNNDLNFSQKKEIIKIILQVFKKHGAQITINNIKFIDKLITHCFLFLDFYWSIPNLPKKLYIGTSGSLIWGKLLCAKVILNGGKVINFEHGRGTILHFFVQKFFTDLNFTSEFINLNKQHSEINFLRYEKLKKKFSLHNFDVIFKAPIKKVQDPFNFKLKKNKFKKFYNNNDNSNNNLKALYVSTCYLGYSSSFRPFIPDLHYLYFQNQVFDFLKKNNIEFELKPHPGGYNRPNQELYKNLSVKLINQSYDDVNIEEFDFIIFDHIASTVTPHIICSSIPSIFLNFNFTELNEILKSDIKNSTYIIDIEQHKNGKFYLDKDLLLNYVNKIKQNKFQELNKSIKKYYD